MQKNQTFQMLASWSGIVYLLLYGLASGVLVQIAPPPSPSLSQAALAAFYVQHHEALLWGNMLCAGLGILYLPWTAQLTVIMLRIEGKDPVLSYSQLLAGLLTVWLSMWCPAVWAGLAFRPNIDPSILYAMNDVNWMVFYLTYMMLSAQAFFVGVVGLFDKSANPVFPRWVSYLAFFLVIVNFPMSATAFFQSGPFAWNGIFVYWIPAYTFFIWMIVTSIYMIRNCHRRKLEAGDIIADPAPRLSPNRRA